MNTNILLAGITKQLKWADGGKVREQLAAAVEKLLGPKTEADLAPPPEKKKVKAPKVRCVVWVLGLSVGVGVGVFWRGGAVGVGFEVGVH